MEQIFYIEFFIKFLEDYMSKNDNEFELQIISKERHKNAFFSDVITYKKKYPYFIQIRNINKNARVVITPYENSCIDVNINYFFDPVSICQIIIDNF